MLEWEAKVYARSAACLQWGYLNKSILKSTITYQLQLVLEMSARREQNNSEKADGDRLHGSHISANNSGLLKSLGLIFMKSDSVELRSRSSRWYLRLWVISSLTNKTAPPPTLQSLDLTYIRYPGGAKRYSLKLYLLKSIGKIKEARWEDRQSRQDTVTRQDSL